MLRRTFLAALAAPRRPWAIGANTAITGWGLYDAIALLARLRFPVIEIHPMGVPEAAPGVFPGFRFNELSDSRKREIKAALRPFRQVTTHLPYTGLDYFGKDPAVADAAVRAVDVALEGSAYFGANLAVLHPKAGGGQTEESQWPLMIERFRRWGDMARKHHIRIALETGYPMSVAGFLRLIREIDHPSVGATLDVGHQGRYAELTARVKPEDRGTPAGIRAYNDTSLAIIAGLGPKLFHLHVHDIDPPSWKEHQPIGTGFVDYPRLFTELDRVRYKGALVLEIAAPAVEMEQHLSGNKQVLEQLLHGK